MKKVVLLLVLLIPACDLEYEYVMQVCTKTDFSDYTCGTGFFISPDIMLTSAHLLDDSEDGTLEIRGSGVDQEIKPSQIIRNFGVRDLIAVRVSGADVKNPFVLCENLDMAPVMMGGRTDEKGCVRWVEGEITESEGVFFRVSEPVGSGFAGGPVWDANRGCVPGYISWSTDSETIATDLTEIKRKLEGL